MPNKPTNNHNGYSCWRLGFIQKMYQQEYSQPQPLYYQQTSSSVPLVASTPNNPNQVKPGGVEPVLVLLLNFVFPGMCIVLMLR